MSFEATLRIWRDWTFKVTAAIDKGLPEPEEEEVEPEAVQSSQSAF